jgi:hypothetical protein
MFNPILDFVCCSGLLVLFIAGQYKSAEARTGLGKAFERLGFKIGVEKCFDDYRHLLKGRKMRELDYGSGGFPRSLC